MSAFASSGLDLFSEPARRNPYPVYERARSLARVLPVPQLNFWMVLDYEDVKHTLNDPETFSSSMFHAGRGNPDWFFFFDPPRHTRLRGLVNRAFTPRIVANLEPRIERMTAALLDPLLERGEMDVVLDLAEPLPAMVIAEMLGIPLEDRPRLTRWTDVILGLSYAVTGGPEAAAATQAYRAADQEMSVLLEALIAERRSAPKEDLLTGLIQAEVDGERLTHREILNFVQLLMVAGTETTTNLIGNAMVCLLENPGELARLRGNPGLVPSAIEEVLRYRSPIQFLFRATKNDAEVGGVTIPAGKLVLPVIGAANRDAKQFAEPGRFDIGREPNPHIVFGHGIHFCIGAPLSRLEGRVVLSYLLKHWRSFEPASAEPWKPRKPLHVLGPASLPIHFQAV